MSKPSKPYRKRKIGDHVLKPESLVMGYGFDPAMSEGSIKPPIFMTSTFVFKSARDGEARTRARAKAQRVAAVVQLDLRVVDGHVHRHRHVARVATSR